MSVKPLLRTVTPCFARRYIGRIRRLRAQRQAKRRTTEQVFTDAYARKLWDSHPDAGDEFCSGGGSTDDHLTSAYVASISTLAAVEGFQGLTFVDLGCGDFRVASRLLPLCSQYIGVDIVKPLVERNNRLYGNATTQFIHLDILTDSLPDAD